MIISLTWRHLLLALICLCSVSSTTIQIHNTPFSVSGALERHWRKLEDDCSVAATYLEAQVGDDGGEAVGPQQRHHQLLQTLIHLVVLQTDSQSDNV